MRPQLAMAALLLLMIGSSLFFLRARPSAQSSVLVTERGIPETETEHVMIQPVPAPRELPAASGPAAPRPAGAKPEAVATRDRESEKPSEASAAAPTNKDDATKGVASEGDALAGAEPTADSMDAATAAFQSGRYVEAQRRFEEIAARGGSEAPTAALQAVEAIRRQGGCPAAAPRYQDVHTRYRDTPSGSEAAWQAGDCYRALGELSRARQNLEALLEVPEYRSRAQAALQELTAREEQVASARKVKAAVGAGAAAPPPATATAAPPANAKPAKPTAP
jgi:TolA-binding protein